MPSQPYVTVKIDLTYQPPQERIAANRVPISREDGDEETREKVLKAAQLTHEIFGYLEKIIWTPAEVGMKAYIPDDTQKEVKKRFEEIGKLLGRELKW